MNKHLLKSIFYLTISEVSVFFFGFILGGGSVSSGIGAVIGYCLFVAILVGASVWRVLKEGTNEI